MTGSKETRAAGASQVNVGNVVTLARVVDRGADRRAANFPLGQHDDHVDALSFAFSKLEGAANIDVWARMRDAYDEAAAVWRRRASIPRSTGADP